ncbi:hypothetical protein BDR07DRAFT_1398914 [Suillus spraguei]|nr:hypothetical protein BDR07DRAFT_1398914 [Suillus spraguei]
MKHANVNVPLAQVVIRCTLCLLLSIMTSTFQANATRRPAILPAPRQVPSGLFGNVHVPSFTTPVVLPPSRCSPAVIEVPALDDKKALYKLATLRNASRTVNGGLVLYCSSTVHLRPPTIVIDGVIIWISRFPYQLVRTVTSLDEIGVT